MISLQCNCGSEVTAREDQAGQVIACPSCGQKVKLACAEALPEGAGDADFDVMLIQTGGPAIGATRIVLGGCEAITIGRLSENFICLPGSQVSRKHARLVRVDFGPSRWRLVDDGSRGGVYINGQRITDQELQSGDRVVIGDFAFEYVATSVPAMATAGGGGDELPELPELPSTLLSSTPAATATAPVREQPAAAGPGFWTKKRIVLASVLGGVALLVVAAILVIAPSAMRAQATAQHIACASQLRLIGMAFMQYEQRHGAYPQRLGDLAATGIVEAEWFVCPFESSKASGAPAGGAQLSAWINQNTSYVYTGPSVPGGILLHDKPDRHGAHGVNALRVDGGVDKLTTAELQQRLTARRPGAR